jgi:hypothetical protein
VLFDFTFYIWETVATYTLCSFFCLFFLQIKAVQTLVSGACRFASLNEGGVIEVEAAGKFKQHLHINLALIL